MGSGVSGLRRPSCALSASQRIRNDLVGRNAAAPVDSSAVSVIDIEGWQEMFDAEIQALGGRLPHTLVEIDHSVDDLSAARLEALASEVCVRPWRRVHDKPWIWLFVSGADAIRFRGGLRPCFPPAPVTFRMLEAAYSKIMGDPQLCHRGIYFRVFQLAAIPVEVMLDWCVDEAEGVWRFDAPSGDEALARSGDQFADRHLRFEFANDLERFEVRFRDDLSRSLAVFDALPGPFVGTADTPDAGQAPEERPAPQALPRDGAEGPE